MRAGAAALRAMATGRAWPILATSAFAWAAVLAGSSGLLLPDLCGGPILPFGGEGANPLALALELNFGPGLLLGWLTMLAAMMLPLLWLPLGHVWDRSLALRRPRAIGLFLLGYGGVWLTALALLWPLGIALRLLAGTAPAALLAGLGLALFWQGTTAKPRLLKRAHRLPPLPAFGLKAEWASLTFGLAAGTACIGAGWALMLLPMIAGDYRLAVMPLAAAAMLAERYAAPPPPRARPPLLIAGFGLLAIALAV